MDEWTIAIYLIYFYNTRVFVYATKCYKAL